MKGFGEYMFPDIFVCAGPEYSTYEKAVAAPLFRKNFELESISNAELVIGCTGYYDIFINGEKVTDGYLSPFTANSEHTVFYRKYEVSSHLKTGKNSVYIHLGNGFANPIGGEIWQQDRRSRRGAPAFAMSFKCNGTEFGAADTEWCSSPLLFDDYRIGTFFDARLVDRITDENNVWQEPQVIDEPRGEKRFVTCEPIREIREIKPASVRKGELREYRIRDVFLGKLHTDCSHMPKTPTCGGYIYDFGENVAGVPKLKIKGEKGQMIHLQFCELLFEGFADYINVDVYPDGCCQKDVYVCNGQDEEVYIPPFTYHGARYCYVYGITPEQATEDLLTFIVLHNDVKKRSDFSCSDEISNEIFKVCRRSDESNLFHILTDCPQREKNGWTGDAAISSDHFLLGYAAEKCFADWLASIRAFQDFDGGIPCVVPCGHGKSDSVVWDSVLFFLPYYSYIYGGNTEIISDNADAMIKNLKYHLSFRDERGIVDRGMGDWLPVDSAAAAYASPLGFCCTVVMLEMCRMGVFMFEKTGNEEYARFCRNTHEELLSAIRTEYCDNGVITAGKTDKYRKPLYRPCQTSQAIGLFFGVFTPDEKQKAVEKLVSLIHENNDSFDCGFLGIRALFHVLAENGYASLAYNMMTKPTHPSYANMIYRGETTVWERFCPPGERTGSHNHHFMAEPSAWYLKYIAGIRVNPNNDNCNKVVVSPIFIDEILSASGHYENDDGRVEVSWKKDESGKIELRVITTGKLDVSVDEKIADNSNVIINFS